MVFNLPTKIICIGNRLQAQDAAALKIYDILRTRKLPENCRLIEGGLAGLNLLSQLEDGGRIVFVDTVTGFTGPGRTVILSVEQVIATFENGGYDHAAGLPYLLAILPRVCTGSLPEEIIVLGIEYDANGDLLNDSIFLEKTADLTMKLARNGLKDNRKQ